MFKLLNALLVFVSRLELDRIRALAPTLVVTALFLCLAVLAVGDRINGARHFVLQMQWYNNSVNVPAMPNRA